MSDIILFAHPTFGVLGIMAAVWILVEALNASEANQGRIRVAVLRRHDLLHRRLDPRRLLVRQLLLRREGGHPEGAVAVRPYPVHGDQGASVLHSADPGALPADRCGPQARIQRSRASLGDGRVSIHHPQRPGDRRCRRDHQLRCEGRLHPYRPKGSRIMSSTAQPAPAWPRRRLIGQEQRSVCSTTQPPRSASPQSLPSCSTRCSPGSRMPTTR